MTERFTNKDREIVIKELGKIQKSKLQAVKPSRKLFIDELKVCLMSFLVEKMIDME